jgi:pimeloyl-ACP methyl ester carboxylesterase
VAAPGEPDLPPTPEDGGLAVVDRPDLVLLHGLGNSSHFFDNLRPALDARYRVHAVDLPGHGPAATGLTAEEAAPAAMARLVVAALERDGVVAPHLVGFSLGGWVALEMAASGYGRSVVALAPPGLWKAPPVAPAHWSGGIGTLALRLAGPLLPALGRWPGLARLAVRRIVADPSTVSTDQLVHAAVDRRDARGAGAARRAVWSARFERGGAIAVPVCVAYGDSDRIVGPPDRDVLGPSVRWVSVPHCGHAISWDHPEACLELIAQTSALASA